VADLEEDLVHQEIQEIRDIQEAVVLKIFNQKDFLIIDEMLR